MTEISSAPVPRSRKVLDAAAHMALDEAILLSAPPGVAVLRFFDWSGDACTFGYSLPYADVRRACDERGWRGVDPVRRATGGGIVFHDGDVTFSLVFPWDRLCSPETIYKNIHRGIHLGLKLGGVANSLWGARQTGLAAACFSRPEKMDVVDGHDRKILGGALRKRGQKGLYQGSLRPDGLGKTVTELRCAVRDGVAREFREVSTEINASWIEAGRTLEARYRSTDWNQRR